MDESNEIVVDQWSTNIMIKIILDYNSYEVVLIITFGRQKNEQKFRPTLHVRKCSLIIDVRLISSSDPNGGIYHETFDLSIIACKLISIYVYN